MYDASREEQLVTGPAGTVAIMNAHMWHGGTANRTSQPRRALHVYYTRWDKPQQQWQKKWLSPEAQRRLPAEARRILALDDPLNDALCACGSGMSGFMKQVAERTLTLVRAEGQTTGVQCGKEESTAENAYRYLLYTGQSLPTF